jgi:DNA-binding transcriptional LysR family regulator
MTRIKDLDLNLLVVLDALLEDRNLTHASRRLGTTQSTLSGALARLRAALGDPLFVRSQRGLVPTPRALALGPVVRDALSRLSEALDAEAAFQPATAHHTFVLAATDYVQAVLLPPLLRLLHQEAPGVRLEVVPVTRTYPWVQLADRDVDLVLGGELGPSASFQSRLLFKDRLVCLLRPGHPRTGALDLAAYLGLEHVEVKVMDGRTMVDELLEELHLERNVVLAVPHFLVALFIALETDLCFTFAQRILLPTIRELPLQVHAVPFSHPPIAIRAIWHERMKEDPVHQWLRGIVFRAGAAL